MDHVITWGDWLVSVLAWVKPLAETAAGIAVTVLAGRVGGPVGAVLASSFGHQIETQAIEYAFGAINGAVKGKTLDVRTNNAVLNAATTYLVANAPKYAAQYSDTLRARLFAKLSAAGAVPETASALDHGVILSPPLK